MSQTGTMASRLEAAVETTGAPLRLSFRGRVLLAAFTVLLAFWLVAGLIVMSLISPPAPL